MSLHWLHVVDHLACIHLSPLQDLVEMVVASLADDRPSKQQFYIQILASDSVTLDNLIINIFDR